MITNMQDLNIGVYQDGQIEYYFTKINLYFCLIPKVKDQEYNLSTK